MATVMSLTILGTSRSCGPERTWHGAHEKLPPPTMRGWRPSWRDPRDQRWSCWRMGMGPNRIAGSFSRRKVSLRVGPRYGARTRRRAPDHDHRHRGRRGAPGRRSESFTPRGRRAEGLHLSISSRKRRRNSRTAWRPRLRPRPLPAGRSEARAGDHDQAGAPGRSGSARRGAGAPAVGLLRARDRQGPQGHGRRRSAARGLHFVRSDSEDLHGRRCAPCRDQDCPLLGACYRPVRRRS